MIGPGIQKNKYALSAVTIRVFNVLNVDTYRLLDHAEMLGVLDELALDSVPQLGTVTLNHTVDELVAFAEGAERAQPEGATGRDRDATAHGGIRRGHRRPAQLQGD